MGWNRWNELEVDGMDGMGWTRWIEEELVRVGWDRMGCDGMGGMAMGWMPGRRN